MNILLIGGPGDVINNMIVKLKKEGHRIYLLTGSRYGKHHYQQVFERYDFDYDTISLNDIFDSTAPDVTLYMGAFDTNYTWDDEVKDASTYITRFLNILMAYSVRGRGRFIYLSSDEVYSGVYEDFLTEDIPASPLGQKATVLSQCEDLCSNMIKNRRLDVVTVRLDNLYGLPEGRNDAISIPARMCLEALEDKRITFDDDSEFALLYEADAIEYIYRLMVSDYHNSNLYNLSSGEPVSKAEIALKIRNEFGSGVELIEENPLPYYTRRVILSNNLYDSEFGCRRFCNSNLIIEKTVAAMKQNPDAYLKSAQEKEPLLTRLKKKAGWFFRAVFPFIENVIFGLIFYNVSNSQLAGEFFAKVDFYLVYVLIFAAVYGQRQAAFSALFATLCYCFTRFGNMDVGDVLLDHNTYVWLAQIFIVGLSVGYMRDTIRKMRSESDDEKEFIARQLRDIQSINSSNVRVKDALETQILNQSNSVGKIYGITSALDQYSQDEVLFYATEMIGQLMNSRDVAIYSISNGDYARLFAASSPKARSMGNSLKYTGTGELYETLVNKKVFINRKMDPQLPMMASAIYEGDEMQVIIMVWGLPWESMTLGQANQLTVIGSLIQNAVLRANRYLDVLENERYAADSKMMESEAFTSLVTAYLNAQRRGLTECIILEITPVGAVSEDGTVTASVDNVESANIIASKLRNSDYVGEMSDGKLYVLLSNTSDSGADIIRNRFRDMGFESKIVKEAASTDTDLDKIGSVA